MLKTITLVIKDSKDVLLAADVLPVIRCRVCDWEKEAEYKDIANKPA